MQPESRAGVTFSDVFISCLLYTSTDHIQNKPGKSTPKCKDSSVIFCYNKMNKKIILSFEDVHFSTSCEIITLCSLNLAHVECLSAVFILWLN